MSDRGHLKVGLSITMLFFLFGYRFLGFSVFIFGLSLILAVIFLIDIIRTRSKFSMVVFVLLVCLGSYMFFH